MKIKTIIYFFVFISLILIINIFTNRIISPIIPYIGILGGIYIGNKELEDQP